MINSLNSVSLSRHNPKLSALLKNKYIAEDVVVANLLTDNKVPAKDLMAIETTATRLVEQFRAQPNKHSMLDNFLQEYGLSNQEGIALMCLAEALLRVPDTATRDELIADKIAPGDWAAHLGHAPNILVNASTWGLMLTGRVMSIEDKWSNTPTQFVADLINKLGEPVIRIAVANAMKILGGEFVLGETIDIAVKRGGKLFPKEQIYSFDMLGEGARTFSQAERHYKSYMDAILRVGAMCESGDVFTCSGVSVKLSAIYPRYEFAKREQVIESVGGQLLELSKAAAKANVKLTVDAEEADRLELSLEIFEFVARSLDLTSWSGFGLAIQAYSKRARHVISWVADLGIELGCRFMVRLVKGAYWDAEIKHAQELGLPDFTVFTRKSSTDLSYFVCAQDMLARSDVLFCQFATHNAHTIAAIMHIGKDKLQSFEFQRLHGMGQAIYAVAQEHFDTFPRVRIYAPVGGHKDLLAYLVRRLLENGANSSFVNRFMDETVMAKDVVKDPIRVTEKLTSIPHDKISKPESIIGKSRVNSKGLDLTSPVSIDVLQSAHDDVYAKTFTAYSLTVNSTPNSESDSGPEIQIINPANSADIVGVAKEIDPAIMPQVFATAKAAQPHWNALGGAARSDILFKAADILEKKTYNLMALLTREAGKTHDDAIAEVREAVDFCRYYGNRAAADFTQAEQLPGPTGEDNSIMLSGRGVFVVISPWNFPLAIFIGQTVAALAAGNSVLTKPAPQTPLIAYEAIKILYEAGVPKDVLQLIIGDGAIGGQLVNHADVAGVAFTGSLKTAKLINLALANKDGPIVPLIAETGGQNVMFVDSTALLEQVTDDVIQSAFKSAGQRCSALRVLYLQDDIADEALDMIKGAIATLSTGNPQRLDSDIGPIIDNEAMRALERHIESLKRQGVSYYQAEKTDLHSGGNYVLPCLFEISNIAELEKEHFGPILHVIRYKAEDLEATIQSAFSTGYGLTLGIHTRMDRRWGDIFKQAPIGNTYVNRNITGAVVGSQPFGGQGLSGTGFKAGGPRYLYKFAAEKTLSVNRMASGGNTDLLTLD